jgi:bifunctional DNA-binding transcriptional regulator/antitoxin component of YhaV-PrlF toxin-antitoxin module
VVLKGNLMAANIYAVTFESEAQSHKDGQFSIPKEVCDILGLESGDQIYLDIRTSSGERFTGQKQLKSGLEIYGTDIAQYVKALQPITVTAAKPQFAARLGDD